MAKNVYILVNEDINEMICASEDKDFVREVMCDCFINDVTFSWYWHLNAIRYRDEELPQIAQETWEDVMAWYDDFMRIRVVEVV